MNAPICTPRTIGAFLYSAARKNVDFVHLLPLLWVDGFMVFLYNGKCQVRQHPPMLMRKDPSERIRVFILSYIPEDPYHLF